MLTPKENAAPEGAAYRSQIIREGVNQGKPRTRSGRSYGPPTHAHWVRVPPDAAGSTLPCSAFSGKHSHYVVLQTGPSTLEISVGHDRGGHWHCRQGEIYHPTFFLTSRSARDVHSPAEAREYLGELGVVDSGLSFAGSARSGFSSTYEFRSPLGEGRYFVHDTGLVEFWLDHPLEIP